MRKTDLEQYAVFLLQFSVQLRISFRDAMKRNNVPVADFLKMYNESLMLMQVQNMNFESRESYDLSQEPTPATKYSSVQLEQLCTDSVDLALNRIPEILAQIEDETIDNPLTYKDLTEMTQLHPSCFGDYFEKTDALIKDLALNNPHRHVEEIDESFRDLAEVNVRELVIPLRQNQYNLQQNMKEYLQHKITKLELSNNLGNVLNNLQTQIDNYVDKVLNDLINPFHRAIHRVESELIIDYTAMMNAMIDQQTFLGSRRYSFRDLQDFNRVLSVSHNSMPFIQ